MAREDWRRRYVILRGPASTTPMLHRWQPGPPYDALVSWCGLMRREASYSWVMLLDSNVAPTVPRCRRCWR